MPRMCISALAFVIYMPVTRAEPNAASGNEETFNSQQASLLRYIENPKKPSLYSQYTSVSIFSVLSPSEMSLDDALLNWRKTKKAFCFKITSVTATKTTSTAIKTKTSFLFFILFV